jgi:hypothetical protein
MPDPDAENQRRTPPQAPGETGQTTPETPRIDQTRTDGFLTGPLARAQGNIGGQKAADFYRQVLFSPEQAARDGAPEQVLEADTPAGKIHLYLQKNGEYQLICDDAPALNSQGTWAAQKDELVIENLGRARGYFAQGEAWLRLNPEKFEAWAETDRPRAIDFHQVRESRPLEERLRAAEERRRATREGRIDRSGEPAKERSDEPSE